MHFLPVFTYGAKTLSLTTSAKVAQCKMETLMIGLSLMDSVTIEGKEHDMIKRVSTLK